MLFTEPFNEWLGKITENEIEGVNAPLRCKLHHPKSAHHYFFAYKDLVNGRAYFLGERERGSSPGVGVRRHKPSFVLSNYFQTRSDRQQIAYIKSIVSHAEKRCNLRPVLGFTRSLGRVKFIRKSIDSHNILLAKNPFNQFFSGRIQQEKHGNAYFLIQYVYIVALSRHVAAIDRFCIAENIEGLNVNSFSDFEVTYKELADRYSFDLALQMKCFSIVYILSYANSKQNCDCIVMPEILGKDERYRREITSVLELETGISLNLSDCKCTTYSDEEKDRFETVFFSMFRFLTPYLKSQGRVSVSLLLRALKSC